MQKHGEIAVWRVKGQFPLAFGHLLRIIFPTGLEQNLKMLKDSTKEYFVASCVCREMLDLQSVLSVSNFKPELLHLDSDI